MRQGTNRLYYIQKIPSSFGRSFIQSGVDIRGIFSRKKDQYAIERIIGVGATSTAVKCTNGEREFVVKIGPKPEINQEKLLNEHFQKADLGLVLPVVDMSCLSALAWYIRSAIPL